MNNSNAITATMQDYLKVMLALSESVHEIRVTDIAAKLDIAKATVAQEINHLKKHGLVTQEKYSAVELTAIGKEVAKEVRWKHVQLRQFLIDVLGVNPKIAESDACLMEHVVSSHTMNRLITYLEAHSNMAGSEKTGTNQNKSIAGLHKSDNKEDENTLAIKTVKTLNELKIGEKGKVLRVSSDKGIRSHVLEMGITPGSEIQMKGCAPMGDPVEVNIKGYHLTLRKTEAAQIFVESEG
jgi:DtxR family Mn-dependent transcriptional regulator